MGSRRLTWFAFNSMVLATAWLTPAKGGEPTARDLIALAPVLDSLERVFELSFSPRESSEHDMTHCNVDHGFARCGVPFIVLAVASVSPQPTEGSLDYPAFRQHHKSFHLCWSQDSLQQPSEGIFHAFRKIVSAIRAVGEDHLQAD